MNTYDEVLYPGHPFRQTHPDRLATLAALFGMEPATVERSRVLELGCGSGGNLIPMAYGLPESEFTGIDLASRPIAKGQAMIKALGLSNITLRQLDLMEIGSDFGEFDYVIAHGLYSWVPPRVQNKILAICRENLAPNGVAYVSYNAYPGSHLRNMIREMMLFHVRQMAEPQQQISQARALIKFLAESKSELDAYGVFVNEEMNQILRRADGVLYHDQLAEINSPIYFYQLIERATEHGLQYLAEAIFSDMQDHSFQPHVSEALRMLTGNNIVIKEQYMDFLKCRGFRQTLLCHEEIRLNRELRPEQMTPFHAASSARAVSPEPDIASASPEEFRSDTAAWATNHPLAKATLLHLGKIWPRSARFDELLAEARSIKSLNSAQESSLAEDALALGEILLGAYRANLVELHTHAPHFVTEVGERPVASGLARLQAQADTVVTNLCHVPVQMEDALVRHLLMLLDGTRDREALLSELSRLVQSGAAIVRQDGQPIGDMHEALENLKEGLEENLAGVARLALLVA